VQQPLRPGCSPSSFRSCCLRSSRPLSSERCCPVGSPHSRSATERLSPLKAPSYSLRWPASDMTRMPRACSSSPASASSSNGRCKVRLVGRPATSVERRPALTLLCDRFLAGLALLAASIVRQFAIASLVCVRRSPYHPHSLRSRLTPSQPDLPERRQSLHGALALPTWFLPRHSLG
jgi:hypothetical protein